MSGGVGAALGEAVEGLPDADQVVEQLLFEPEEIGALDMPSPMSAAFEPRRRGPGRPKGARNRRTEAVAGWLLSQGRHPVLVMMEAYSMSPGALAEAWGLRKHVGIRKEQREVAGGIVTVEVEVPTDYYSNDVLLEVAKIQLRMAEAAAPYVAQKLPQAVQIAASAALQVTLAMGGPAGVSLPARGGPGGGGPVVEGEVMGVRLGHKSDDGSRNDA